MMRPGMELMSPGPLANTQPTWPMTWFNTSLYMQYVYIQQIYIFIIYTIYNIKQLYDTYLYYIINAYLYSQRINTCVYIYIYTKCMPI